MEKGIFLKELGIYEYGWTLNDIKNIIDILDKKQILILGGDVYKLDNRGIYRTYDSWYINLSDELDFYTNSYENAMSYIFNYEKRIKDSSFIRLFFNVAYQPELQ